MLVNPKLRQKCHQLHGCTFSLPGVQASYAMGRMLRQLIQQHGTHDTTFGLEKKRLSFWSLAYDSLRKRTGSLRSHNRENVRCLVRFVEGLFFVVPRWVNWPGWWRSTTVLNRPPNCAGGIQGHV